MNKVDALASLRAADPATDEAMTAVLEAEPITEVLARTVSTGRDRAVTARKVRPRRLVLGFASVAAATVVGVVVAGVAVSPGNVAGPTAASAAEVLHAAGATARNQPELVLTGDEVVYNGYLGRSGSAGVAADNEKGPTTFLPETTAYEYWTDATGESVSRMRPYSDRAARTTSIPAGRAMWFDRVVGQNKGVYRPLTYAQLQAVPTEPAALRAYLVTAKSPPAAAGQPANAEVAAAVRMLTRPLTPPKLRGALYDVLADLPGVTNLGPDTDEFGRQGIRIGYPTKASDPGDDRGSLLIDPSTATTLERRAPALSDAEVRREFPDAASFRAAFGDPARIPAQARGEIRTFATPVVVSKDRTEPPGGFAIGTDVVVR